DGGFILTSFIGPGHSFGEFTVFTDLPLSHDISAVGPTTLINIPGQKFLDLCEAEPAYLAALLRATLLRSHVLIEMLHALRLLPLVPRVAKYLLIMAPHKSSKAKLHFRQTDFAATLGLSRASMNRALSELEDLGLIRRSYGCVEICSVPGLSRWLEHAVGDD
ncbi:MAG: Crp/Fnr family transcriptional regulator, partial [Hyphomonas sp.]